MKPSPKIPKPKHKYYICLMCGNTWKGSTHSCDECNSTEIKLINPSKDI